MKGSVIALFCAVALVHAEINENGCPINPALDVLKPHPNCNKYFQCNQGELLERECALNLVFNVIIQECDWAENVDCENRVIVGPNSSEETSQPDNGGGHSDPSLAPEICAAEGSDGILVAHENCKKFYECDNGVPVAHKCASTLQFNPSIGECDWPENVNCDRNPDCSNGGSSESDESGNGDSGNGDSESGESGNGGNSNPCEALKICAAEGSNGVLVAHENCNQFYECSGGVPVAFNCAGDLLFNPAKNQCDWPENVNCVDRNRDCGNGGNSNPCEALKICAAEGSNGVLVAHENCNQFYECSEGLPVAFNCAGDLLFNPAKNQCDWPENVNCVDRNRDCGNGGNSNPCEALKICAAEESNGVLVAHENCNQFYECSGGVPVAFNCARGLLFNPAKNQCDWPDNVNCVDRNPDGGNCGNSNTDEALKICATEGSNGVLLAHENCNQFYECSGGLPVAFNCARGLLFNPAKNQCDWPENVNCGDRKPDGGNRGNSNPCEALKICAAEGSNGVLVAHEKCNQFYECSGGVPVAFNCAGNLLFNPAKNRCDWPENVNCVDRNRDCGNGGNSNPCEALKICAAEGSNGVLVAHENCNQFYECSGGLPVAFNCAGGLLFNPAKNQCDWPENVNCGDRNPDGGNGDSGNGDNGNGGDDSDKVSGGNSDPSLASEICAAEDSQGVLVAHENCNQFYICNGGKPGAQTCWGHLLFNPAFERCDWPENVNCGSRKTFSSLNKHLRHAHRM